jgi:hypothetical protein
VCEFGCHGASTARLEDRRTHPAAAIILCGAALENALSATVEVRDLELDESPCISASARRLRGTEFLTAHDIKDIEQCSGLGDLAAMASLRI